MNQLFCLADERRFGIITAFHPVYPDLFFMLFMVLFCSYLVPERSFPVLCRIFHRLGVLLGSGVSLNDMRPSGYGMSGSMYL